MTLTLPTETTIGSFMGHQPFNISSSQLIYSEPYQIHLSAISTTAGLKSSRTFSRSEAAGRAASTG